MKPHTALKYITPDEVAECWEGVFGQGNLYEALWDCVEHYEKIDREDCGPHDVIGINSVASFWSRFSTAHKQILNRMAVENEKLGIGDIWSEEGDIG